MPRPTASKRESAHLTTLAPYGRYHLLSTIANGGMGELHLARTHRSGAPAMDPLRETTMAKNRVSARLCVIKRLRATISDPTLLTRFHHELSLMSRLTHRNLVPVVECGDVEGSPYLALAHIEGIDLQRLFEVLRDRNLPFAPQLSLYVAHEIAAALNYVHTYRGLNIIHRDMNPSNILLSFSGCVYLIDFGIASSCLLQTEVHTHGALGTAGYIAPEQSTVADDIVQPIDCRADLYSLGMILRELAALAAKPLAALDAIIEKATATDRNDRYHDAEAMRSDLITLLARSAPTTGCTALASALRAIYGDTIIETQQYNESLLEIEAPRPTEPLSADRGAESPPTGVPGFAKGTVLNERYRIEDAIGEGGMGAVYRAQHLGIERNVAIKVLHPAFSLTPEIVTRFLYEARLASRIDHPNIIKVFDSGVTDDGLVYFVMEELEGRDLAEVLAGECSEQPMALERAVQIAFAVSCSLSAVHSANIIHRDLKPENIFIATAQDGSEIVKIVDFGVARAIDRESTDRKPQTSPGMIMGTPDYMAPEQVQGTPCDHRIDIYALGAILYEMIAGCPPYPPVAGDMRALARRMNCRELPLHHFRKEAPPNLAELCHRALDHNPANRPPTMEAFSDEVATISVELARLETNPALLPGLTTEILSDSKPARSNPAVSISRGGRAKVGYGALLLLAGAAIGFLVARFLL